MSTIDTNKPPTLQYATAGAGYMDPATLAHCRRYAALSIGTAVLSGCCVAVCFVTMNLNGDPMARLLHAAVFGATIVVAVLAGTSIMAAAALQSIGASRHTIVILDCVAAIGLVVIGIAPFLLGSQPNRGGASLLAVGYACLTVTTWRHVLHYRLAATLSSLQTGHPARGLIRLGWCKAIYEGIWLACCTAALAAIQLRPSRNSDDIIMPLAIAAFVGCFGYGIIWIVMIVLHTKMSMRFARGD